MWAYVLNATSWVLTSIGFATMVPDQAASVLGPEFSWVISVLIGCTASAAVQAVLAATWTEFGSNGRGFAVVTLILALLFSSLSWYGSASSSTALWGGDRIQREKLTEQATQTSAPLEAFATDYATLAAEMNMLAGKSRDLAGRESRVGGTCEGDTAQKKCGMKCRLRNRQADELQARQADTLVLRDRAAAISTQMAIAPSVEDQQAAFSAAMALNASEEKAYLALSLRQMISDLGPDGFSDPNGGHGTCRDADFESDLQRVLAIIERPVELPDAGPAAVVADFSDGSVCVRAALGLPEACSDYSHAYFPMGLAGAIEFAAAYLLWRRGRRRWEEGRIQTKAEAFAAVKDKNLTEADREDAARLVQAYRNWALNVGEEMVIFAVPIDGALEAHEEAERLCHEFGIVHPVARHVDMTNPNLYPAWVTARDHLHRGARHFDWYEAPADAPLIIRRARRRARQRQ